MCSIRSEESNSGLEMVYSMKSLLHKREDLSSDAQHTYKIGAVPSHVNLIRVQKNPSGSLPES